MNCIRCKKTNLPGGLRCVYCGVPFYHDLDFEFGNGVRPHIAENALETTPSQRTQGGTRKRGLWSTLAVLGLKLKSILLALKFGKILLSLGSMLLYISAVSTIYGARFGVGLAVCIFVHEVGHIVVNKFNRVPTSLPMFIPFFGAYVTMKKFPDDPRLHAECAAGGPAAGLLASLFCLGMGIYTHASLWYVLSYISALVNLFNLMATSVLDGAAIFKVFSPRIANFVLISLLLIALKNGFDATSGMSTMVLLLICVAGLVTRMNSARNQDHLLTSPAVRLRMAFVYIGLCTTLALVGQYAISHAPATPHTVHGGSISAEDHLANQNVEPLTESSDPYSLIFAEIGAGTAVLLFWPAAAGLLMRASRRRNAARAVLYGIGFWLLTGLQIGSGYLLQSGEPVIFCVSLFAGGLAALLFAIYAYMHRDICAAQGYSLLTAQAMLWAAGAQLTVAFAFNAISPVMMGALTLTVTLLLFRCMVPLLAGHLSAGIADSKAAVRWYTSAVNLNPSPDTAAHILKVKAALEVALGHGAEANVSLRNAAETLPDESPDIATRILRCRASILQEHWDRALTEIEAILSCTSDDLLVHRRLCFGHRLLAEMCALRGWFDEAASQAERALKESIKTEPDVNAELLLTRARCRAALGNYELALLDVSRAEKMSETRTASQIAAAVKAQVAISQQLYQKAIAITTDALREQDGSLELTYLQASALHAAGKSAEAAAIYKEIAASYPGDHWGKLAARAL